MKNELMRERPLASCLLTGDIDSNVQRFILLPHPQVLAIL